ncbi:OmpA family protein [Aliikangiella maris]|uniref:OmpA family protein n=2 Tax=Aliikangiella maris TaxID=3162458 RepID=A0ABV2BPA7_9GAMM
MIRNYQRAFSQSGFEIIFQCLPNTCGSEIESFLEQPRILGNLSPNFRQESPVFFVKHVANNQTSYLLLSSSDWSNYIDIYLSIIEVYQPVYDKVKIDNAAYQKHLNGNVNNYGKVDKDIENSQDHPLVSRYKTFNFIDVALPIKAISSDEPKSEILTVEGRGTFIKYMTALGVSQLDVLRNYDNAFKQAGFQPLLACENQDCGNYMENYLEKDTVFRKIGPNLKSESPVRVMKHSSEGKNTYVALAIADWERELDIFLAVLEEGELKQGKVAINADYLASKIAKTGKVALYGIEFDFDFDSDKVKSKSFTLIKEIANYLKHNAAQKIYIVGHAGATGDEDYNILLSKKRAQSVRKILIEQHQIAADRLKARGAGDWAPVSTNQNEEGKALSRRVELVLDL